MKKIFLLLVLILGNVLPTGSAFALSLSLIPSATTINLSDPVTVDVNVGELGNGVPPSLGAFLVEVPFDPNVLTFNSESYGSFLGGHEPISI